MKGYGQVFRVEGMGFGVWNLEYGDVLEHAQPRTLPAVGCRIWGPGFVSMWGLVIRG